MLAEHALVHPNLILSIYFILIPNPSTPPRNTQIQDTCIVFSSWHITSTQSFVFSFFVIVALGVLYEWLREAQKAADRKIAATLSAQGKGKSRVSGRTSPAEDHEEAGLLTGLRVVKDDNG